MKKKIAIHWFRQDLRLSDNNSLVQAAKHNAVLPIYILDNKNSNKNFIGSASRFWLYHSLTALNKSIDMNLSFYIGDPLSVLDEIKTRFDIEAVYWNRCYEPWRINRDKIIKKKLTSQGISVKTFNGSLLWEPWNIKSEDDSPYKVFTHFYRRGCLNAIEPTYPVTMPKNVNYICDTLNLDITQLNLLPEKSWDKKLLSNWTIGEMAAQEKFKIFIDKGLPSYKDARNFPAKQCVSRLSPHLHYGEISPNQLWHGVRNIGFDKHIQHFCSELGWREFSYNLLYFNPDLPIKNLQEKFDSFPWKNDPIALDAWKKGQTGIPMVDAGMRELWNTGYMHNRLRMIVGSFLVKNLLIHWHHGERWFWDTLLDADLANNSASWQWVAGCGADAAQYFRIFNPIVQAKKFDPNGEYIRKHIPEIASLPNKYLFCPWEAPAEILKNSDIEIGSTYPKPIVNLEKSRELALQSFELLRKKDL